MAVPAVDPNLSGLYPQSQPEVGSPAFNMPIDQQSIGVPSDQQAPPPYQEHFPGSIENVNTDAQHINPPPHDSMTNMPTSPGDKNNMQHHLPAILSYPLQESTMHPQAGHHLMPNHAPDQASDYKNSIPASVHDQFQPGPPPPEPYYAEPHIHNTNYHQSYKPLKIKQYREKPQIQVVTQAAEPKSGVAESMQMMMMNQMMMQQMQAQQMQAAQMASMNQQNMQFQSQQMQNLNGNGNSKQNNKVSAKSRSSVNIKTSPQKVRRRSVNPKIRPLVKPRVMAGFVPPIAVNAQSQSSAIESVAMDNWQEATIILCFAAVGLIYLICSRAGGEEKKEDLARKHMS